MLVVNGLIGAGIFGLPSGAAALAGEYSVLVYSLLCAFDSTHYFMFCRTGEVISEELADPSVIGTLAFGPFVGFQGGWLYYLARLISFSANTVLLTDFHRLFHRWGRYG